MAGIKRTQADHWFSMCVRERAEWNCQGCGKHFPEGHRGGLDCSHIFGRANYGVRYHPDNALAHCTSCHFKFSANPVEFARHANQVYGEEAISRVEQIKNTATSGKGFRKKEIQKEISKHYREEYRAMLDKRMDGETGWLEFVGYE